MKLEPDCHKRACQLISAAGRRRAYPSRPAGSARNASHWTTQTRQATRLLGKHRIPHPQPNMERSLG